MSFAWDRYLARVGLEGVPKPDESGLRALHEAQFLNIPFENFDIPLGRGVSLDAHHVFDKLVNHRRGGYCFELNGLMLEALLAAGFQARPILARVHLEPEPSGLTHQMSLVELDGRSWLMDVGFGAGGLRCPLPIEVDRSEENSAWGFRIVADDHWGMMMQSREKGV
ncbi:MAG: N-hydroxyarylamine O-acetyltransferase, partial [Candidatus Krumholzibacteriia bacterium]